jgi:Gpi18-like mannosyltransferase
MRLASEALHKQLSSNTLLVALLLAMMVIVVGVGLGWENNKIVPVNPVKSAHYNLEPRNHVSFMSDWDGPLYLDIAHHGYTSKIEANFFPLYPLTVRFVNTFVNSLVDSGLLVAWVCLVGAIYFYLKIIKQLYGLKDNLEAVRGALFFILFPTAVFLLATYTESLFAFLALGAIYCALRKKYISAGLFAMLATATHVDGVFVVLLIGLLLAEKQEKAIKIAASMAIGSLGIISYMVWQKIRFNNPLEFIIAQKNHSWLNFDATHLASIFVSLNGLFIVLLLVSVIYWWPRRKSFSLYSLFYASIIFVSGRDLGGIGRYTLVAFPLQFMLYDYFRNKKIGYPLILALSAILWTFFTLRYAGGYTGG